MARRSQDFQTIHSEGGLLPHDLLRRVLDPKAKLDGTRPEDYGLPKSERLNEAITQSWNRLIKHWSEFRADTANLPLDEAGTGITNDKWSLPLLRELGFGLLPTSAGPHVGGRSYAINRFFGSVPIHLIGCGLSLDRRAAGQRGAAAINPHGLVQEFLNRSHGHLWGILSNGLCLRVLRDNQALSRQSYLEFDLESMFAGEVYSDFVLLWLMAHASRFNPRESGRAETCWLEDWSKLAEEDGTRALGDLRGGVENALQVLGEGFTSHPKNSALRDQLRSGQLALTTFHGQLLRVVYRLIFLFVAEDRKLEGQALLHPRDDTDIARSARERYASYYSTARLRELAGKIKGSRHGDLWRQFQVLLGPLSGEAAYEVVRRSLALPALGSFLWSPNSTTALNEAELTNHDFLEALRNLAFIRQGKVLRPVDYQNLGAEELGGVYESLLALTPQISGDGARFTFAELSGNERKTSGSYYTPDSLVQCLLDSALDPVVEETIKDKTGAEAEKAILSLKVCDPAVGSGHFLVGAAHRLAQHLARVRAQALGESEPSPLLYQHALRDVIGKCLYGVDINPMAAELCRVGLWLEALEPGKPLSFLEHHIQVGNSLLGATPALLRKGIPDEAFTPIEGDDKAYCKELKKKNKRERDEQGDLFDPAQPWNRLGDLASSMSHLDALPGDTAEQIAEKRRRYEAMVHSSGYEYGRLWADAWCAAFMWKKIRQQNGGLPFALTEGYFRKMEHNPHSIAPWMKDEIKRLAAQYQFFHWHLAFPDVFRLPDRDEQPESEQTGWNGGFDVMLGNPPWRMTEDDSRIEGDLEGESTTEIPSDADDSRVKRERAFFARSGRLPLSSQNRMQLARLFAELFTLSRNSNGAAGMIVPSTLTVNSFDRPLWTYWIRTRLIYCVFDFVNHRLLFPEVDSRQKFAIICLRSHGSPTFHARCWLTDPSQLKAEADQSVVLSESDLFRYSGQELALPHFRGKSDLALLDYSISRFGRIDNSSDWSPEYVLLGTTNEKDFIKHRRRAQSTEQENSPSQTAQEWVPLYEGKMVSIYDHRAARVLWKSGNVKRRAQEQKLTELQKADPNLFATPLWEVPKSLLHSREAAFSRRGWDIALCDVTSSQNERTALSAIVPLCFATHNLPLVRVSDGHPRTSVHFLAAICSMALDYFARLRVATNHLTEGIFNGLPIPSIEYISRGCNRHLGSDISVRQRVLELTYTAWDLEPFARSCGYVGPPFRWDEERRFLLRAELDAAFFHLYLPADDQGDWVPARKSDGCPNEESPEGLTRLKQSFPKPRDAVSYILDTFPIIRRKDEEKYNGDYRTKRVILEIYDALAEAQRTGKPYQTRLDPLPGPPCDAQENFIPMAKWTRADWPSHIHQPGKAVVAKPDEVPVAVFAAMAYPATDADKAICAAALAVVEQSGGLSSMEHLDALLLATHPDWCKAFSTKRGQTALEAARKSAPSVLFVGQGQSINWKECRDYLEKLKALIVAHDTKGQPIGAGTALAATKASLPTGIEGVVTCALKALERIRDLRNDLSSVPQAQRLILDAFAEQHRLCGLAA